eukprot:CAMPEP_0201688592 /NCGR_PEP_ID=MMETSP0578-20130828/2326_1 /ASSEMBLY_ACC=CAM_ASM_000663 /TAXON_ID=267565 /ORGANISM="Skeletonema grethea, Strain CCMP 1804" /LENGTH=454 /DNA_ID=CAMNT_0048172959 /DNA_START=119 /DNA_END=1482 /DNA_ORIENTATION=+
MNSSPPPTMMHHMRAPPIPTQIVIDDDLPPSNRRRPSPSSSTQPPPAINPPRNLPLVDEIDLRQCFTFDKLPSPASMQGMVIGKEELNVICGRATQSFDDAANHTYCSHHGGGGGGNNVSPSQSPVRKGDYKACPCCRRYIENFDAPVSPGSVETSSTVEQQQQQQIQLQRQRSDVSPQKSNLNSSNSGDNVNIMEVDHQDSEEYGSWNLQRSMLTSTMGSSLLSLFNGGLDDLDAEEEFNMSAPPLVQGDKVQHYTVTETIVQGWLYKKGSGNDIWGRRWWKPRWVTLALAVHPGQTVPMPLIISHHAPGVPFPAHVMELNESTVIMAIERTTKTKVDADGEDIEEWNRHCFQIVNSGTNEARMFTAPMQERNEWAFVINKELYSMEERLKKARAKEEAGQYTLAAEGGEEGEEAGDGWFVERDEATCESGWAKEYWFTTKSVTFEVKLVQQV